MCYVFNCFGWLLDLIQRIITFFLACWMAYAVCIGLTVAAVAGIAYGYNYSLAEFVTFTQSNVTVYMQRGQFYDHADVVPDRSYRRYGGRETEDDQLSSNMAIDYEEHRRHNIEHHAATLSESWRKVQDTREYAERLLKFNYKPHDLQTFDVVQGESLSTKTEESSTFVPTPSPVYYKFTTLPLHIRKLIPMTPNIIMSHTLLQSGTSNVVTRDFYPIKEVTPSRTSPKDYGNKDYSNQLEQMDVVEYPDYKRIISLQPKSEYILKDRPVLVTQLEELKDPSDVEERPQKPITMRHWVAGNGLKNFPAEESYGTSNKTFGI